MEAGCDGKVVSPLGSIADHTDLLTICWFTIFTSSLKYSGVQVPFVSLHPLHDPIRAEIHRHIDRLIDTSDFILGAEVSSFESEYATYGGTRYCLGASNGLDALKVALRALGISQGDEVIVPANTYIASIFAIMEIGATPVLAEPDEHTCNVTAVSIKPLISSRTKAIMPVHLYGQPCDMDPILALASQQGLYVVEDNAQAQGATYRGKRTGSFGHINGTSFYPSKNLGAMGDAGAITTDDQKLYQRAAMLRNMGSEKKYYHELSGYNARLDTIQAAILRCKLPYLDRWNEERRRIAARYRYNLRDRTDLTLPYTIADAVPVYHLFVIRHERRDALQSYLAEYGIQTLIHYPVPVHLQPALTGFGWRQGQFPLTEEISRTCLSLPLFVGMTDHQVDFVSEKILAFTQQ